MRILGVPYSQPRRLWVSQRFLLSTEWVEAQYSRWSRLHRATSIECAHRGCYPGSRGHGQPPHHGRFGNDGPDSEKWGENLPESLGLKPHKSQVPHGFHGSPLGSSPMSGPAPGHAVNIAGASWWKSLRSDGGWFIRRWCPNVPMSQWKITQLKRGHNLQQIFVLVMSKITQNGGHWPTPVLTTRWGFP